MASFNFPFLLLLPLFLLLQPFSSIANLHKINSLLKSNLIDQFNQTLDARIPPTEPTVYFEVRKPIRVPKTKPCTLRILQHQFGYTYGKPPVFADYNPPLDCPSQDFSKIVLEWKASSKGRQFDRIFGVWLGGVELLRSCTAEPRQTGTVWRVKKDITRYYSLLMKKDTQKLAVYLGNIVDKTYTGVYNVIITVYFYPAEEKSTGNFMHNMGDKADLILPISRDLPLDDGLWLEVKNSTDIQSKQFSIPQNAYKAVLEVYVSFHENDEFWYGNLPNDYIAANHLTDTPGNGPFREVLVNLDGHLVGAVWPFSVIYTGGVNPLLWRPITAIGSFDLPSYDIDITPFLGTILDGQAHEISFGVTNALNVWYIDANLHLWLDPTNSKTKGMLLNHQAPSLYFDYKSDFNGPNGNFVSIAKRLISSSGWVQSSYGNITSHFSQNFGYINSMTMGNDGNSQNVDQIIHFDDKSYTEAPSPSSKPLPAESFKKFHTYLNTNSVDQGDGNSSFLSKVVLGFFEEKFKDKDRKSRVSFLKNVQSAKGVMIVKENLVVGGLGSTEQKYRSKDVDSCYFRKISSKNYIILNDETDANCKKSTPTRFGFGLNGRIPFSARRAIAASNYLNDGGA